MLQHKELKPTLSIFWSNLSDSSCSCCLARRFRNCDRMKMGSDDHVEQHPAWSMSSLMTALPESPSTISSSTTTFAPITRHSYFSHTPNHSTQFSTPKHQGSVKSRNIDNDTNNLSTCLSDIDEWLEQANKFCNHLTESVHSGKNGNSEEDLRLSAICNTYITAQEHELHNITLPCVREESPVFQAQTRLTCKYRTAKWGGYERTRLIGPYDELLDDIRRRKQEAEREARKKAKHVELMLRMRRKENAINDWELQQTRKAMDKMDKIQNELERKQFRASARTQKKICLVREKAEKQKLNLRRSTLKRFQLMQTSKTHSPSEIYWGSPPPLC